MDFELPKVKDESEDTSKTRLSIIDDVKDLEVPEIAAKPSDDVSADVNLFENVAFGNPEEDSDSSVKAEGEEASTFGAQKDFSDPVEYVVDEPKIEEKEEVQPIEAPLKPTPIGNLDLEDNPDSRIFSKKSSMAFVVLCVAVVFFSLGGLVGFYFGTKKAPAEENVPKENANQEPPAKPEDNTPPSKPEEKTTQEDVPVENPVDDQLESGIASEEEMVLAEEELDQIPNNPEPIIEANGEAGDTNNIE